jgi:type VI secretion system VgrG family protein
MTLVDEVREKVVFQSSAIGSHMVRALEGEEELNLEYHFRIHLDVEADTISSRDLEAALESDASLSFIEDTRELNRYSGKILRIAAEMDSEHRRMKLEINLAPRLALAGQHHGSELFVSRSVPAVLAEKLHRLGMKADRDYAFLLEDTYPVREFIAQYEETDLAFIRRTCEAWGIAIAIEEHNGCDRVVFGDGLTPPVPIDRPSLNVHHRRERGATQDVTTTLRRIPRTIVVHDYNYRTPVVQLRDRVPTDATGAIGDWSEYGDHAKTTAESNHLARVRAEEARSSQRIISGVTGEASLRAGRTFRLTDAGGTTEELLIRRVEFQYRIDGSEAHAPSWKNRFIAIPREVRFRPARVTKTPRIAGLLTAVVDGATRGDYAEIDELGRYHLRFSHDPSGLTDLSATHPVRMMQPHAGSNYGMHFPLRPGTEVLVAFVNGDPDRPIIVGSAPNPVQTSPVVLGNQTQNVLRTGARNELVLEDRKGEERIRLHTPHSNTSIELGSPHDGEEGLLLVTDAHVTTESRQSNNVLAERQTSIARASTTLADHVALTLAGLPQVARDDLAAPPPLKSHGATRAAERAEAAVFDLVRKAGEAAEMGLQHSLGRLQGQALSGVSQPAAITAGERTAALVSQDVALVSGDRVAGMTSADSVVVFGEKSAVMKSSDKAEVAAANHLNLTTAGELNVAASTARVVAGYFPEVEAPPLSNEVSLGIMARRDLRIHSIEDCILICAEKNLVGSAHTGDVRLNAHQTVQLAASAIEGTSATIHFQSSDRTQIGSDATMDLVAGDALNLQGTTVTITAGQIKLVGNVMVEGNLFVAGESNLKKA